MRSNSLWNEISIRENNYPELLEDQEADIVIIGGGITGITAAYQLMKTNKKVILIEANQIASGTTSFSTGNLYLSVQPYYHIIKEKWGIETVRTIAHARQLAINYIECTVLEHNIPCHFTRRPWYAYTIENESLLAKELRVLKQIGLSVEYTKQLPLALRYNKAIEVPNQARFNPLQYVLALAKKVAEQGGLIYENTKVIKIEETNQCIVSTHKAKIAASKVLIATHTPIGINPVQLYTAPYRSYVLAATLKNKTYPEGHFMSFDKPKPVFCTHSVSKAEPELVLIAGNHHKTGQDHDINYYADLQKILDQQFEIDEIKFKWSAQHYHSADNVPYIGLATNSSKHTYMATGYFADGLIYGTIAGIIIADLFTENENELLKTFNSTRHNLAASAPFLLKENINVFYQYLKDLPTPWHKQFSNLRQGEGTVVEVNQRKYAVSRDDKEQLHIVSATCTHMKGIVNWNPLEQTWDCPCHGSRFNQQGELLEGPAMTSLSKYDTLD